VTIPGLVRGLCPVASTGNSSGIPSGKSGGQIVRMEFRRNSDRTMTGKNASFSPEKFDFWK